MKKDILFTLPSYFRDDMNIMAYRFGKGEKTCAVVGALRGERYSSSMSARGSSPSCARWRRKTAFSRARAL